MLNMVIRVSLSVLVISAAVFSLLLVFGGTTWDETQDGMTKIFAVTAIVAAASVAVSFLMRKN